ncbi:hypothetical protein JZ751_014990 [Albula glossodonta]|uniref:Uncharacterized protein n=1 Tax=Albula glossodonta TaxID=121402 RepID=A0A8T2N3Y0_9TELE|nr:hypothetical protein JZ751_014990 [Albula glossodonta]
MLHSGVAAVPQLALQVVLQPDAVQGRGRDSTQYRNSHSSALSQGATPRCPLTCPHSVSAFGSGPSFGGVTTGGSSFGFASSSKPSGGSLSAGFGSSSTSGFNFSNPGINASAGLTFGVSNPPAAGFGTGPPLLQLKKPPVGNKRGKR